MAFDSRLKLVVCMKFYKSYQMKKLFRKQLKQRNREKKLRIKEVLIRSLYRCIRILIIIEEVVEILLI